MAEEETIFRKIEMSMNSQNDLVDVLQRGDQVTIVRTKEVELVSIGVYNERYRDKLGSPKEIKEPSEGEKTSCLR